MKKGKFEVTGMTCTACSSHVEKAVCQLDGVKEAAVSLMTNSMTVSYDEGALSAGDTLRRWNRLAMAASERETAQRRPLLSKLPGTAPWKRSFAI